MAVYRQIWQPVSVAFIPCSRVKNVSEDVCNLGIFDGGNCSFGSLSLFYAAGPVVVLTVEGWILAVCKSYGAVSKSRNAYSNPMGLDLLFFPGFCAEFSVKGMGRISAVF